MMRRFFPSTIRQVSADLPFVFEINTNNTSAGSTTNTQFRLPLTGGTQDFLVDWGDGNTDNITLFNQAETTHTYLSAGTYIITISGVCNNWFFQGTGDRLKMLEINQWGIIRFQDSTSNVVGPFSQCANLKVFALDSPVLPDQVGAFFRQCNNLGNNSIFNHWDVSNVTNFVGMFRQCAGFNCNIGSWDMSNATNISTIVAVCAAFNQNISSWDVSNVTDFTSVFNGTTAFNQNIGGWDVSSATTMASMFQSATNFNQNIGSWNVSNVTNFTLFMTGKTNLNYSAANLDAIYNGWSSRPVKTPITITFNTIKYTAAGQAGRDILTGAPNNWSITDGGI